MVQGPIEAGIDYVVVVDLTNEGSDQGQMTPMLDQLKERHGRVPGEHLVDGGFASLAGLTEASERGTTVYAPVVKPKDATRDRYEPLPGDPVEVAEWRRRMGTETAKEIYKDRAGEYDE